MLECIGRAKIKHEEFIQDFEAIFNDERKNHTVWQSLYKLRKNGMPEDDFKIVSGVHDNTFNKNQWDGFSSYKSRIETAFEEMKELELEWKCYLIHEDVCLVGPSTTIQACYIIPKKYVEVEGYRDYSALTGSERHAAMQGRDDGFDLAPKEVQPLSMTTVKNIKSLQQHELVSLEAEKQKIEQAQCAELDDLRKQLEEAQNALEQKKSELLAAMDEKLEALKDKMRSTEVEILKLDSEIYSIRCFTGEVVEFRKLTSGRLGDETEPIIFYQKMRYLDEELGKIGAIYNADFSKAKFFENLLKEDKHFRDAFAPNERSITLIRVSRTNRIFRGAEYDSMLEVYEKYHGTKVGLIIRDGENLYIGWTDDDRIFFSEDAFFKAGEYEADEEEFKKLEQGKYESDKDYKERIHGYQMNKAKGQLGRYYIFSIINGLISRKVIKFPETVEEGRPDNLIIFSYADGWLTTDKYGSFSDMWERCNQEITVGDKILTVQGIRPDFRGWGNNFQYEWNNDRGRGEKNRTHDVAADNNTIYPINLVEHYATYDVVEEHGPDRNEKTATWTDEELENHRSRTYWKAVDVKKKEGSDRYKYFISLEKTENWMTGKCARANFEVYEDEFINLTYMNSVWIEYVINNQKTSDIRVGGQKVDFAYLIKYLNTILKHCREREDQFSSWIRELGFGRILEDEEWPVKLSNWMMENNIHNFSKFRAKQFSRFVIEHENK